MPRLLRMILVLLLSSTLAATAVLAAPLGGAPPRRSATVAPAPMDFVAELWGFLIRVWSKNGSQMDPDGTKNGSVIEPNGSPLQAPAPVTTNQDNGHQVDPNG